MALCGKLHGAEEGHLNHFLWKATWENGPTHNTEGLKMFKAYFGAPHVVVVRFLYSDFLEFVFSSGPCRLAGSGCLEYFGRGFYDLATLLEKPMS